MKKEVSKEHHNKSGFSLRDIILGGQDGLVNVLGVVLGVAGATNDARIIVISGLAATFAESIAMAAVAFTSTKAADAYYQSELEREKREINEVPDLEVKEIRDIYYKKGFRGKLLNDIVDKITSNKKIWLDIMMKEELGLSKEDHLPPRKSAIVVGFSALGGSLIPLFPFFAFSVSTGIIYSFIFSIIALFTTGAVKAKITVGDWRKSGIEMALIGIGAALVGYGIGVLIGSLL